MRRRLIEIAFLLSAALTGGVALAQTPPPTEPVPFVVNRGSAPPPPALATAAAPAAAPVEGATASGFEFGRWRSADPELYGAAFETRMRQRYAGKTSAEARADLEAAGFACVTGAALQCRIEIVDAGCEKGWYVVFEDARPEPIAGFDAICPRG
jgi:hypothetical protein